MSFTYVAWARALPKYQAKRKITPSTRNALSVPVSLLKTPRAWVPEFSSRATRVLPTERIEAKLPVGREADEKESIYTGADAASHSVGRRYGDTHKAERDRALGAK